MYKKYIKRLIDILVGLVGCIGFLVAFIFVAPVIYLTDKGPVFYMAERRGMNGKNFKMFKFRSMYVNSPNILNADGSTYNGDDDPRVTKIGRILRKTSVDELPQFINVLKGDMSLIGPRPNNATKPYEELDEIGKKRLCVRPGITGYNQAYFRNSVTSAEKYKNDCYYVDNVSFVLDVKIIFKTVETVLARKNVYVNQSGPVSEEALAQKESSVK